MTEPPITIIRKAAIVPVASSATEREGELRSSTTASRAAGSLERLAAAPASASRPRAHSGRQITRPPASPTSATTVVAGASSATSVQPQTSTAPHANTARSEGLIARVSDSVRPRPSGWALAAARRIPSAGSSVAANAARMPPPSAISTVWAVTMCAEPTGNAAAR